MDYELDNAGYVFLSEFCIERLREQTQYTARYVNGRFPDEYPNLGRGLRFQNLKGDYGDIKIHVDDIEEFCRRVLEFREHWRSSGFPF